MVYSNKYKFRKLRGTVQDSINEERARLNEDFNRKLKNAEDSMKAIYPEEYKKIRSRYFGNGNNLGLIGSQFNYIHNMITRNSDEQMKKYYNELNDYFVKQTGTEPGYMLQGVDVVDEAPDFNALRQKDFDRFYSPTENSDYLNSVEKQNARNAYLALQNKNADSTFDHDGYFDYNPNNGLLNTEANYARAQGSYNYTPEEREAAATWERAQNSPIVTAMEFSPLFPVVAGVKAVAAANAPQASGVDVGMNAAFASLPAIGAGVKAINNTRKLMRKPKPTQMTILQEPPRLENPPDIVTFEDIRSSLDENGDLSKMAYFNMTPREVMEQIDKDKSLIDIGKKFKVDDLSTDSYPLVLHTMMSKKSPNFNVVYTGQKMHLNNYGKLEGEEAVNRINKKIKDLNSDRNLSIPLAKMEKPQTDELLSDFYNNNNGFAANRMRNEFDSFKDFKSAYDADDEIKTLVDYIIKAKNDIVVPYLEAIRMYKSGGIHINHKNEGKFTEAANRAGMGVQEYARHILANKENYSPTMVRRANFARNASKWKHDDGGAVPPFKSFDDWYRSIYHNANDTTDYNLRRAYELAPIGELEAWRSDPDKNHLHTGYWNGDVYEFMKSKDHPTVNYELDWYNSPDADDFRSRYMLDTTTGNYKYVPRYKVKVTF